MFIQPWYKGWNIPYLSGSLSISWVRLWSVKTLQPGRALGILNGWADDAGYDVTSSGWVVPGATRLQQCELLIIHLRHFSGITAPRLSSAPGAVINLPSLVRLPLSVRDSDADYCEVTSLADLRSYHRSPRHYGCQGYLWSHREYLLNPLKFNGEHKSGMRGMWNAILFLWRHYPPGVLTSEIISNRHKVEWINAGNLSKISDTTDNISHRFHDKVGAKYTGINAG